MSAGRKGREGANWRRLPPGGCLACREAHSLQRQRPRRGNGAARSQGVHGRPEDKRGRGPGDLHPPRTPAIHPETRADRTMEAGLHIHQLRSRAAFTGRLRGGPSYPLGGQVRTPAQNKDLPRLAHKRGPQIGPGLPAADPGAQAGRLEVGGALGAASEVSPQCPHAPAVPCPVIQPGPQPWGPRELQPTVKTGPGPFCPLPG